MKIFHEENERNVVYVQIFDLKFITREIDNIPKFVLDKIDKLDNASMTDFEKFDRDYEVSFFKNLDFILNYDDYKDFTDEQLKECCKSISDEYHNSLKKWFALSNAERLLAFNSSSKINKKFNHDIESIQEIYYMKHNARHMPFKDC